ncbi:GTP-binding protein Era [Gottschalkia acidurici 9a]|uniref:GTPase Era n=1 Tax=Gottschalkia acidurici (strain ATCC 7906 / DSM 604 / BCRC 14475 / CIP 104303 / KCTC 5404 / NCIMB 10678 / 9a) TaxID=1128398 RepID=K0B168_GOTA9|nr:GTPase Era [Gottschalkia acidurici]AFS78817.1 GTP-binding protein Era [Gottschalkia acidurici 9a]
MYKSGFVTIIGRPNVGKSTLLNRVIGEKIAIISNKPQTTRNKIQCVYTEEEAQIVFIDTPGIHKPKNKLGEYMVSASKDTLKEVDVILWLVDESTKIGPGDEYILEEIKEINTTKILVINKIDKINQDEVKEIISNYENLNVFDHIIPISAQDGQGVNYLLKTIKEIIPEGPQYFPDDMITDQPERLIVSEIIREKALHYLEEEVPHGVAVGIELMRKRENKDIIDINAIIYCERSSHKGIIIGKGGKKLKGIGKSAREDIERLLGSKVYLEIWVKVEKNWRDKEKTIKYFGYV